MKIFPRMPLAALVVMGSALLAVVVAVAVVSTKHGNLLGTLLLAIAAVLIFTAAVAAVVKRNLYSGEEWDDVRHLMPIVGASVVCYVAVVLVIYHGLGALILPMTAVVLFDLGLRFARWHTRRRRELHE